MERGHAQIEAQFVYRLQTLGGFGGKADQLNAYSVFLDDPAYFERDWHAIEASRQRTCTGSREDICAPTIEWR